MNELAALIRDIPDFPQKGIIFKDISTLLLDPKGWAMTIDQLTAHFANQPIDKVLGVEARGFAVAAPLAYKLNTGLILARKPGKLPWKTRGVDYQLEYGTARLEIHEDAIKPGENILIVDDLLATGGTVEAAAKLVESFSGRVMGIGFIIELEFLNGKSKIDRYPYFSLIKF